MVAVQPSATSSPSFRFRSASLSHAGAIRKLNRDACLERADVGLWAVADGMGGDQSAGIGASAIVRALARVDDFESAFASRRALRAALVRVNLDLMTRATEESLQGVGASVITLLARETSYACMWVGTARAYAFRSGALIHIGRDHFQLRDLVGSNSKLEIEGVNGQIEAGDRFLLCSDGLAVIDEADISEIVSRQVSAAAVASALIKRSLELNVADNVSVVVIDTEFA